MRNLEIPLFKYVLPEDVRDTGVVSVPGGQSNYVIGAINIPQGVNIVRALVAAKDNTNVDAAGYVLQATFSNYESRMVKATGTLTVSGAISNNETVVVGGKTYTWKTTLTGADGEVLIEGAVTDSLANLQNAINLGAGAGTKYGAAMTANAAVTCTGKTATTVVVTAIVRGTPGNSIGSTETMTNGAWGGATLSGGVNATLIAGSADAVAQEIDSGWAAALVVNGANDTVEIQVTSDGTNATLFRGILSVANLL